MTIGQKIREKRKKLGLKQSELAVKAGFNDDGTGIRISQYESDKRVPKEKTLEAIAQALDVSPHYLKCVNFTDNTAFIHYLYDLEREFGVNLSKNENGEFTLTFPAEFSLSAEEIYQRISHLDGNDFKKAYEELTVGSNVYGNIVGILAKWYDKKKDLENKTINSFEYEEWKSKNPK